MHTLAHMNIRTRIHTRRVTRARARTRLQAGLEARGFQVLRLSTYSTLLVSSLDEQLLQQAKQAAVVTVGSPSAIK